MKFKQSGDWTKGRPKIRRNGQWVSPGSTGGGTDTTESAGSGFTWDQTFSDTSWLSSAGDDLNVEKVTNTDSGGAGSLQDAIDSASGPTVVVFEVGGVIDVRDSGSINVGPDNVWIAGETAPDPGISIIGGGIVVDGSEVIVSHIGAYRGDAVEEGESLKVYGNDVVFDHCTALWGTDEVAGASPRVDRASFINCIIAEGLYDSIHPEGKHSRGLLFNSWGPEESIMGCLFANNNRRNPLTRADVVMANNYIYNGGWDGEIVHFNGDTSDATSLGLYVEDGPDSATGDPVHIYDANLYHEDIVTKPSGRTVADSSINVVDSPPLLPSGFDPSESAVSGEETKDFCLGISGMRPAARPPVDTNFLQNRVGGDRGAPVNSQNDVGGYPDYDGQTRTLDVPDTGLLDWLLGYKSDVEGTSSTEETTTSSDTPN